MKRETAAVFPLVLDCFASLAMTKKGWTTLERTPAVYIMASARNGTLYTGVTSNLVRRVHQHRIGQAPGFTLRYGCKRLVWYELHDTMPLAIAREKQLKGASRRRKLDLIEDMNPTWRDLYEELF